MSFFVLYLFIILLYYSDKDMPNYFDRISLIGAINRALMPGQVIFCHLLINCINILYFILISNYQNSSCITNLTLMSMAKKSNFVYYFYKFLAWIIVLYVICHIFSLSALNYPQHHFSTIFGYLVLYFVIIKKLC